MMASMSGTSGPRPQTETPIAPGTKHAVGVARRAFRVR